jgi:hypothetical protein
VLLILALVCRLMADQASLSRVWNWLARSGVAVAALLTPGGVFFSSMGRGRERPNALLSLVVAGGLALAAGLATLRIGLPTLRIGLPTA